MKNTCIICLLGFTLLLACMALLSPYDLAVSQSFFDRSSCLSRFVQSFGEVPGWILIGLSLWVVWHGAKNFSSLVIYRNMALGVIVHALVLPLVVTQLFKFLWGRVRFLHLSPDFSNFTPFWMPAGFNVGLSFPSGHVAMAMLGTSLPFFLWKVDRKITAIIVLIADFGWGVVVSWGRITAGSHYLTDCLFSFGIAWIFAPVLAARWGAGKNENLPRTPWEKS
jgi:membrane-associated phospholipid phosphatase